MSQNNRTATIWGNSTPIDDSRRQTTTPQNALQRLPNQRPVQLFTIDPSRYIGEGAIPLPQDHKRRFLKEDPSELQKRIDFCGKAPNNVSAFDDPLFSSLCGICVAAEASAGDIAGLYYSPDERIDNPKALNPKPTFGSCPAGAFAVTREQYISKKKQLECITGINASTSITGSKSADCATCIETLERGSFPEDTPNAPAHILLGGVGQVAVYAENSAEPLAQGQLEDGVRVPLSPYGEGAVLILKVRGSAVSGVLSGLVASGRYVIDIAKIIDVDSTTGMAPRKQGFIGLGAHTRVLRMIPGMGSQTMELPLRIPMTFLEPGQAATCTESPIARKQQSLEQLGATKCGVYGARPGNYPLDCLQYIWTVNGCTPKGRGYPRDLKTAPALLWKNTGSSSAARTLREIHEFVGDIGSIAHSGTDREGNKVSRLEAAEAVTFCFGPNGSVPKRAQPVVQHVLSAHSTDTSIASKLAMILPPEGSPAPGSLKAKLQGRPTTINSWLTAAATAFSNMF